MTSLVTKTWVLGSRVLFWNTGIATESMWASEAGLMLPSW